MKISYYVKNIGRQLLPRAYFRQRLKHYQSFSAHIDNTQLIERVSYYCKPQPWEKFNQDTIRSKDFRFQKPSAYFFDLKEYLYYFNDNFRFNYHFGDETFETEIPTIFKAREIGNAKAVLFKLDKYRHFKWTDDKNSFSDKKDVLVWRGAAHQPIRKALVKSFINQPGFDVGDTSSYMEKQYQKPFLTLDEQLKSKFIFCPEGYDVATSLKWVMSSNSLCIMPKPTKESWFMEGSLKAGHHYAQVKDDLSNLEETIQYYIKHPKKAEDIIKNAHQHVAMFQDKDLEDLLSIAVLERYAQLSGQKNVSILNSNGIL